MIKRIGSIEVNAPAKINKNSCFDISIYYNPEMKAAITLTGYDQVLDVKYAIKTIKRKMEEGPENETK